MGMSSRVRLVAVVLSAGLLVPAATACTPDVVVDRPPPPPSTSVASPPPPQLNPDAGLSNPVADPLYPQYGNPALDVLQYALAVSWIPDQRVLAGTATLTIRAVRPVRELSLDFSDAYTVE